MTNANAELKNTTGQDEAPLDVETHAIQPGIHYPATFNIHVPSESALEIAIHGEYCINFADPDDEPTQDVPIQSMREVIYGLESAEVENYLAAAEFAIHDVPSCERPTRDLRGPARRATGGAP